MDYFFCFGCGAMSVAVVWFVAVVLRSFRLGGSEIGSDKIDVTMTDGDVRDLVERRYMRLDDDDGEFEVRILVVREEATVGN